MCVLPLSTGLKHLPLEMHSAGRWLTALHRLSDPAPAVTGRLNLNSGEKTKAKGLGILPIRPGPGIALDDIKSNERLDSSDQQTRLVGYYRNFVVKYTMPL